MNQLTQYLYLADVSSTIKGWALFFAIIFGIITVLTLMVCLIGWIVATIAAEGNEQSKKEAEEFVPVTVKLLKWTFPFFVVFLLVDCLLPSQQTFMLMAASQLGEEVLKTDAAQVMGGELGSTANDSVKLLHKWVEDQLNPPASTKKQ